MTLGTHEQPFERAIDLVTGLTPEHALVVQHGHTRPRRDLPDIEWFDFLANEEFAAYVERADAVVCHAGVGTIMTVLAAGKTPVVLARLKRHGEHVDDHQLQITRAFDELGLVVSAEEAGSLDAAIARARTATPAHRGGGSALRRAVRVAAIG